ncbi:DEKNAAC105516 [Brettanomyces naardenensis]|uniref:DEKNAAC105516 n=1 Tax=Brettanomyces naardenensis TaxID=13370 RepID=A0A448YTT8_BRENA|nr:DEKNAAC105516 [Brettanomyces naardenensis]
MQLNKSGIMSSWEQVKFSLSPRARGCYLVTDEVVRALPQIKNYKVGMVNLFLQHTSAGLSLNENWDPDVRSDMTKALNKVVPDDNGQVFDHVDEGPDDMSGHAKSSIIGVSLNIPITDGRLALGTWQGIWMLEFRNYRHTRYCLATITGLKG